MNTDVFLFAAALSVRAAMKVSQSIESMLDISVLDGLANSSIRSAGAKKQ